MAKVKKLKGNFTLVANTWLKDTNLSAKAKGILCYLQSVNDDWEYSIAGLATQFKDGYDSIKSGLDELEQAGYIKWERLRTENGQFADVSVQLFEKPNKDQPNSGKSQVGEIGNNKIKTNTKERLKQNKETLTEVKGEVVEYGNHSINDLFNYWTEQTGFEQKTKVKLNRFACQRLLKSRGEQAIRNAIQVVAKSHQDKYAPTIMNFMDLEEKWDNLRVWYQKNMVTKLKTNGTIVI